MSTAPPSKEIPIAFYKKEVVKGFKNTPEGRLLTVKSAVGPRPLFRSRETHFKLYEDHLLGKNCAPQSLLILADEKEMAYQDALPTKRGSLSYLIRAAESSDSKIANEAQYRLTIMWIISWCKNRSFNPIEETNLPELACYLLEKKLDIASEFTFSDQLFSLAKDAMKAAIYEIGRYDGNIELVERTLKLMDSIIKYYEDKIVSANESKNSSKSILSAYTGQTRFAIERFTDLVEEIKENYFSGRKKELFKKIISMLKPLFAKLPLVSSASSLGF